ncbi:TetR family transcriptional regulator [Rhizobium sp. RU20A]|uniref:TetR family transcriptional regulator n=1 Tax=Rhizobium sp. RU20A TaxID=1907412 RepID=UPI00122C9C41|nr:TetR family transcriptional regulator [Rhizobium sp. RU20A]
MNALAEAHQETSRHQENVTRILDAAERLFRHYGYTKTTVADIARDLGMSSANIYRFFGSKVEIHQALASRMLAAHYDLVCNAASLDATASDRLRAYVLNQYNMTVETMLDEQKVHEMVVIAMERDWSVIDAHFDRVNEVLAGIIRDGIAAGEFAEQDADAAARCFSASIVTLCHPQVVAQCLAKTNRATVDELIEFAIRALKA